MTSPPTPIPARTPLAGFAAAILPALALALALGFSSVSTAVAQPLEPDPHQPPNGVSAPGYRTDQLTTPWYSPIQVPRPIVRGGGPLPRTVVYRAYPFLAGWLHTAIGWQPLELRGAARISFRNPVDGRTVIVNPNGHCDFTDGRHLGAGTELAPIRVDLGAAAVTIHPRLHLRAPRG